MLAPLVRTSISVIGTPLNRFRLLYLEVPRGSAHPSRRVRVCGTMPGRRGPGFVVEGLAAVRRGARLEAEPRAGGGGSGDGDGDDGHQVGEAGPGRAGQLDRARGID